MLVFIFVVLVLLYESMFCFAMSKRTHSKAIKATEKKPRSDMIKDNTFGVKAGALSLLVSTILSLTNDLTFLLLKVAGYIPCHFIRILLYKYIFRMNLGKKVVIYYGLEARAPWNISIGDGSVIGDHAVLDARFGIAIGNNVNLSTGVWIWTLQHDVNSPSFGTEGQGAKVDIGDRAWISSRTVILPGCDILKGDVIAAGAVVTKKCMEEYGIYGGVPSRLIARRNDNLLYEFDGRHRHFI